ncbi:MAG TPA: ABC transporter ATP-binding protein [Nocardioidaceae bacterium]|nr:ABC transporter ATP-binding protein [Nocardioidaceae bacterium]
MPRPAGQGVVTATAEPVLAVEDLTVRLPTHDGVVHAVTGLTYQVRPGETLGIVGESGSGKTVSALAVLGLHDRQARVSGSVRVAGTEVVGAPERTLRRLRGNEVAMVFQDPLSALHPYYPVGRQIAEAHLAHHGVSRAAARARAVEMLDRVGIAQADRRADDFPHQMSGGMRQRAMIAMALVNDPRLVVADEPTTALDVTVQAQILDLLRDLQRETGSAVVLITHDLGVVAETADRMLVMYGGRAVESGRTRDVLADPKMPYTWGLLSSMPDLDADVHVPLRPIQGTPPSLVDPPGGCPFHPRCPHVADVPGGRCRTELPLLEARAEGGHLSRCHLGDPDAVRSRSLGRRDG